MPSYNPPVRGQQFIFYLGLPSQSDPKTMQSNPTLASGDAKVSKDGGALANLNTLPAVTPASGKLVKVTLSASEMDADNVTVVLSDAAGAEWCDVVANIQPSGLGWTGTVNDASATTTSFDTTLTQADDFFNKSFILFTDGALQGQSRKISDFANTGGTVTLASALTAAPADGDPFIILGRSE
jgi:hypothetical protein